MIRVVVDSAGLILSNLLPRSQGIAAAWPRRGLMAAALILLLPPVLIYYWAGLWLDELLFRRYRRLPVHQPVFILGVPRTGTTALHEALAEDPQFTTTSTWECLLAPSITHRYAWRALARLDRALGAPLRRLARVFNERWITPLTNAHPLSLHGPEEDYLTLLPQLSAFILIVIAPDANRLWRLGRGDQALSQTERRRLMRHYRRSIQRHLYFHGSEQTYLAKNASYATLAGSLLDTFPDARLIACLREPDQVVSSQLSSLQPTLRTLHGAIHQDEFNDRMLRQLRFAYTNLLQVLPDRAGEQAVFLPLNAQREGLGAAITSIYSGLSIPLSAEFEQRLQALDERARHHRSGHRHSLSDQGLNDAQIQARFGDIQSHFDFAATAPIAANAIKPLPSRLRVAVVCDSEPGRNGVGTYYSDLVNHLADRMEAIQLIAPGVENPPLRHWATFKLPGDDTQRIALPAPGSLYHALRAQQPDVIIVAAPGPYGILASFMSRRLGAAMILGLHTDFEALSSLYWRGIAGRINQFFMQGINEWLFRRADAVVSNSEHMHTLAQEKGAAKAVKVNTPLARVLLDTPTQPPHLPPERVLFVGRLAVEKRVGSMIEAAEAHPDRAFFIAGDGPERERVEAATARLPNLHYHGWVSRDRLVEILDGADLLVLPSAVEAFGTVALEAMVRGRLTLVTPGCGIADWPAFRPYLEIMDGEETLAEAISRIAKTPAVALERKATGGQQAAESMARQAIEEWVELMNRL